MEVRHKVLKKQIKKIWITIYPTTHLLILFLTQLKNIHKLRIIIVDGENIRDKNGILCNIPYWIEHNRPILKVGNMNSTQGI